MKKSFFYNWVVQFDSMAFQERNGTCGMKLERSGWNLVEKSGTDRDLK